MTEHKSKYHVRSIGVGYSGNPSFSYLEGTGKCSSSDRDSNYEMSKRLPDSVDNVVNCNYKLMKR